MINCCDVFGLKEDGTNGKKYPVCVVIKEDTLHFAATILKFSDFAQVVKESPCTITRFYDQHQNLWLAAYNEDTEDTIACNCFIADENFAY